MKDSKPLETVCLTKRFGPIVAVSRATVQVERGEVCGIIGANGCGKTSLLNLISGFLRPDAGYVRIRGEDVTPSQVSYRARKGLARSFQEARVMEGLTVLEHVLFAVKAGSWLGISRSEVKGAMALLETAGLEGASDQPASQLSYGQQKILSVLMCRVPGAYVWLLDEPFASVSTADSIPIEEQIQDFARNGGCVLLAEHNLSIVEKLCMSAFLMEKGFVYRMGSPEDLSSRPVVQKAILGL